MKVIHLENWSFPCSWFSWHWGPRGTWTMGRSTTTKGSKRRIGTLPLDPASLAFCLTFRWHLKKKQKVKLGCHFFHIQNKTKLTHISYSLFMYVSALYTHLLHLLYLHSTFHPSISLPCLFLIHFEALYSLSSCHIPSSPGMQGA